MISTAMDRTNPLTRVNMTASCYRKTSNWDADERRLRKYIRKLLMILHSQNGLIMFFNERLINPRSSASASNALLELSDHVDEQPLVPVTEVGQIIREFAEVVADSQLDVVAHLPIDTQQNPAQPVLGIGQIKHAPLDQGVPLVHEMPIDTGNVQVGTAGEELRIDPVLTQLAVPESVFAPDAQPLGEVVHRIEREDVALLNEIRGRIR